MSDYMQVEIRFVIEPEDYEQDPEHPTGLTDAAFDKFTNALERLGGLDMEFRVLP